MLSSEILLNGFLAVGLANVFTLLGIYGYGRMRRDPNDLKGALIILVAIAPLGLTALALKLS
jgi:hypothetical protein